MRLLAYTGSYEQAKLLSLAGNIFRDNRAGLSTSGQDGVLSIGSNGAAKWEIHGNEFANPSSLYEITLFEYFGNSPSQTHVNGTNNLFGFQPNPSETDVSQAIWDATDDASLPVFNFIPFLTSDYEITCDSNCTGRGSCTFPGYCICEPGWGGGNCASPTCQNIGFCSGHGSCVGFDDCDCEQGWLGQSCSMADCSEVRKMVSISVDFST